MTIGRPSNSQRSAGQIHHAETGQKEVELAHALKPGDADDFPRAQAERGVLQLAESREPLRPERLGLDPPGGDRARRKCMRQRPPYDHGDDGVVVEVRDRPGGDMCAISQYRHGAAKRAHLPQTMGNEDDRQAAPLEVGDDRAQPVDIAAGERRRRLVEQKDARLAKDRPGDFDLLLDRQIQPAHLVVERDIGHVERGEMLADELAGPAAANRAQRPHRAVGQEHVVEDGEVLDQSHLLERRLNAALMRRARARQPRLLVEHPETTAVGKRQSGEQPDDRRFARAVLTEKGVDAAGADRE